MARNSAASQKKLYDKRAAAGLCPSCGKTPPLGYTLCEICNRRKILYYSNNKQYQLEANRKYKAKLRDEVFAAYGGAHCWCCGTKHIEFLTVDHIDGGGAKHRKEVGCGVVFYRWLRDNGYPPGYRILCMNCNFAHGMYGYCPHDKGESDE